MTSPSQISAETGPVQSQTEGIQEGLLKTGLIGASALTVTWWALIACGLWQAIEWVRV